MIAVLLCCLAASRPIPVVLSSDCGCEMDDQWAIALLATSPEIDLRLIVAAHAPGLTPESARGQAAAVLAACSKGPKVEVVAGATQALVDIKTPRRNAGVDALLAQSKGFGRDDRLVVVMIGSATDVASALLIDPGFADRARVVAMAFDDWEHGGDPWNVKNDVAAWQVVMTSGVPLVVADGAITTKRLTLSRAQAKQRFAGLGKAAEHLLKIQSDWLDRSADLCKKTTGDAHAWPVWDCGAAAVLLGAATVENRPRPTLRDDRTFDHHHPKGTIGWVTAIDGAAVWDRLAIQLRDPK
jgi:inosine-uridine nucleoside N-ribohydrolase